MFRPYIWERGEEMSFRTVDGQERAKWGWMEVMNNEGEIHLLVSFLFKW